MFDFIEFVFPCDQCLVSAACKDKKQITIKDFNDRNGGVRCLALPSFDSTQDSLAKVFVSCVAGITTRFADHFRNEEQSVGVSEEFRHFLIDYFAILQHIANSTSWRERTDGIADFDKRELKLKLERAIRWLS
jgi:hypothetical protein